MLKAAIFDLDMCIFDTRDTRRATVAPIMDVLRAHGYTEAAIAPIADAFLSMSLDELIANFDIASQVGEEMWERFRVLDVPDDVHTFGDEQVIPTLSLTNFLVTTGYERFKKQKIEKLHIAHMFKEVIIDARDTTLPHLGKHAIFADILSRYGWTGNEVMAIGDRPRSELAAGKALGMVTVQTLRPSIVREEGFDHYIHSFTELPAIISKYQV